MNGDLDKFLFSINYLAVIISYSKENWSKNCQHVSGMFFLVADIYPRTYVSIAMKFGHLMKDGRKENCVIMTSIGNKLLDYTKRQKFG